MGPLLQSSYYHGLGKIYELDKEVPTYMRSEHLKHAMQVCYDKSMTNTSVVVCKQLGIGGPSSITNAYAQRGGIDGIACKGSESGIAQCRWGNVVSRCTEAASITCSPPSGAVPCW